MRKLSTFSAKIQSIYFWYICSSHIFQITIQYLTKSYNTGIILLAAGSSSRLGHNKLLVVIDGMTLLEHTLQAATHSISDEILVVLGAKQEENQQLLDEFNIETIINKNWSKGIGSSIKCGIEALLNKRKKLDAVIISVCDQPYLSSNIFDQLIEKYKDSGKPIVASDYSASIGVPVLYDKSMFAELKQIPDEHGAKKHILVHAEKEIMTTIPFPKGDVDIDSMDDIKNLSPYQSNEEF